jgi:hypothetical protein
MIAICLNKMGDMDKDNKHTGLTVTSNRGPSERAKEPVTS